MAETTIVVLEGDETGQELLEEALRVLARRSSASSSRSTGTTSRSRSAARRRTRSCIDAAAAIREHGLGLKAATITPKAPTTSARRTGFSARRSAAG